MSRETLDFMNRVQAHRGPDGHGVFLKNSVGLAHVRLAILDLTEAGHQPLELEGFALTYNGEVYNYIELREELEKKGHKFRSDCDTEVVMRSYMEWGQDCVKRFNGMFSFAIWDSHKNQLFCARDRLGIKPFFYFWKNGHFEFASEIKALLHEPSRRQPRLRTLVRFFGEGLTDDEWESFFQNIEILPPAHTMVVSEKGLEKSRYWTMDASSRWQDLRSSSGKDLDFHSERAADADYFPADKNLEDASDAFRELFLDSVKLRLRSDVPVGTCLSGGLDSSSVVTCATSLIDRPVETFSSIYPDRGYDEKRFIDEVNNTVNTSAHPITSDGLDLPDIFDKIVWAQDEPTAGPGLYSQWKVMEEAQKSVTVLLDGQGGDELLAGYHHYFREYLSELAKELRAAKKPLEEVLKVAEVIKEVTGHCHKDLAERAIRRAKRPGFLKLLTKERPGKVKTPAILHRDLAKAVNRKDATRMDIHKIFDNSLSQKLYNDLTRFSIPPLLRYEDRNSMAFSLEARVPFLDHRLVEFCFALPNDFKIAPPHTKLVLRRAMNGRLPKAVTQRQDKLGYPTPVANWFRAELKTWIQDLFSSQEFASCELLDTQACQEVLRDHLGGSNRSWDLWRILHGYRWNELYLRGKGFAS